MFPDNIAVNLRDVLMFSRKEGRYHTNPRDFSSLAFRLNAKSKYLYNGKKILTSTNYVSFVPDGIAYDQIGRDTSAIVFHFDMLPYLPREIEVFEFVEPKKYETLFREALQVWDEKAPGYKYRATAYFYEILAAMQRDRASMGGSNADFAVRAKEYMDGHFSNPSLTISHLAADAYVSEVYLRRRFKQRYHIGPKQYLDSLRIRYAASLLQAGYFSQAEIASRCGYRDVKYFRTLFKKKMGCCISQYCKMQQ